MGGVEDDLLLGVRAAQCEVAECSRDPPWTGCSRSEGDAAARLRSMDAQLSLRRPLVEESVGVSGWHRSSTASYSARYCAKRFLDGDASRSCKGILLPICVHVSRPRCSWAEVAPMDVHRAMEMRPYRFKCARVSRPGCRRAKLVAACV